MNWLKTHIDKLVVLLIVFLLGGFLCLSNMESRLLRSQVRDLQVQLAESSQKVDTFYIRDSVRVWKERIVEVDKTDYKKQLADRELIKDLKLKVSQVESENRTLLSSRDTVYLSADSVKESGGKVFRYSDQWADFAYFDDDKRLEYAVRDSLTTIVSREYKHRFLWLKWGLKGYNVHIVNHNPHSRVAYSKYIRVKR